MSLRDFERSGSPPPFRSWSWFMGGAMLLLLVAFLLPQSARLTPGVLAGALGAVGLALLFRKGLY